MPIDILRTTLTNYAEIAGTPVISWHGGEPTMAGLGFYRAAMEIIDELSWQKPVVNQLQTNAVAISPQLAELFHERGFQVGISLDGTCTMNDLHRKTKTGKPTSKSIWRGIEVLRSAGNDPWVIATVTRQTLSQAVEAFDYFVGHEFTNIRFTPVFDVGDNTFSITAQEWGDCLIQLFDRWFEIENPNIHLRELEQVMAWYIGKETGLCNGTSRCANWVSVDECGNLYPCEYFKADYAYGNIRSTRLEEIPSTDAFRRYQQQFSSAPDKCRDCEFARYCGNGCPATRVMNGIMNPAGVDYYCEAKQRLFKHIKTVFDAYLAPKGGGALA